MQCCAREVNRSLQRYQVEKNRCEDDACQRIREHIEDYLDYLRQYYPFKEDYADKLSRTVLQQLHNILVRRRQLDHTALKEVCEHNNIDWFAQPFFGARKLSLSNILAEYDEYRYNKSYKPSIDCQSYLLIEHVGEDNEYAAVRSRSLSPSNSMRRNGAEPDRE